MLSKPLEDLALLLGFDIPLVPSLAIAGVKADGAIIHWSLPEKQRGKSSFKYEILLNGVVVDSASVHEDAVIISGLQADKFYIARVALVHNQEFSSKSAPIRFRTKPASSGDFFQPQALDADLDSEAAPLVRVQTYRGLKDVANEQLVAPVPAIPRKRSNTNWRNAAVVVEAETQQVGVEAIDDLTERLDELRREHDEADRQAKEEEEEEQKQKDDLVKERDELRADFAEREKISRNLKKEVNIMERQNTAAQNERSKHERMLQQKLQERAKLKEDAVKWADEALTFMTQAEEIEHERMAYLERAASTKAALETRLATETALVKNLDDDIRETAAEIKKMERGVTNNSPSMDNHVSLVEQFQQDAEEDRLHNTRKYDLQNQYAAAVQRLEQAKQIYINNVQYLESLRERRQREEVAAAAASSSRDLTTLQERPMRQNSQSSRQHDSPRPSLYSPVSQPIFGAGAAAPAFTTGSIFSFGSAPADNEDLQKLTAGALLSPEAAEGFIPADLFAADDRHEVQPLPGLGALPGVSQLPGLGYTHEPVSPVSMSSRAASTFASPQASQQNLPFFLNSPDGFADSDGRSIRSNRSGLASGNTGSRFSAMFGLRQRPKNSSLDDANTGAPLGRFNSHSMPRQDQGLVGLGSASRKRNSSISGNHLAAPDADESTPPQIRKRPFTLNPFSKDKAGDAWPSTFSPFTKRPVSPRPVSTQSGELTRPSLDGSRWAVDSWQASESNAARASPLSLGGWTLPHNLGSAQSSRHQSIQHGMASQDIIEDDLDVIENSSEHQLAPIGTRPTNKKALEQMDVKLNPNAKDFKSFLSSMRLRDRDKSKGRLDGSSKATTPLAESQPFPNERDSPSHSRASRDGLSTTTLESSSESRRPSNELILSPTYSNSEAAASPHVGSNKESFMQKITRKSSSSKFTLPTFKREKSRLDRDSSVTASPNVPPAEDDEDDMSTSVSSLREPRESSDKVRGTARSWSNVLKLGKKKAGTETPSVSELSTASEATGDEDAEE